MTGWMAYFEANWWRMYCFLIFNTAIMNLQHQKFYSIIYFAYVRFLMLGVVRLQTWWFDIFIKYWTLQKPPGDATVLLLTIKVCGCPSYTYMYVLLRFWDYVRAFAIKIEDGRAETMSKCTPFDMKWPWFILSVVHLMCYGYEKVTLSEKSIFTILTVVYFMIKK